MHIEKMMCGALLYWMISINSAAASTLTIPTPQHAQDEFAIELLKQIMVSQQSINYHSFARELSTPGIINALKYDDISVAWLPAEYANTKGLEAIRFPIFKGAFSYYQIYTATNSGYVFNHAMDLDGIALGLRQGDGKKTDLRRNGFEIVEFPNETSLKMMLEGERFDAALIPIFAEHAAGRTITGLQPKDTIVAVFNPYYFVVSSSNTILASQIRAGLNLLHDNGQLNNTFYQTRWISTAITELESNDYQFLPIDTVATMTAKKSMDKALLVNLKPHQLLTSK